MIFLKNKCLFIYFWLRWVFVAARGLSLVAGSGGYSSLWCAGFSLRWLLLLRSTASRRAGFSSCGSRASVVVARGLQQLWLAGSVAVARGLQSTGSVVVARGLSCSTACGIFPDQGSNPCPLHWQADSQPLHHQGSPGGQFLNKGLGLDHVCLKQGRHGSGQNRRAGNLDMM